MKATFVQNGNIIDYTPSTDLAAGDVVLVGNVIGVAVSPIAANALGALTLTGVFSIEKDNSEIAVGAALYWDDTDKVITTSASGNKLVGYAIAAAAAAAERVSAMLNSSWGPYGTAASATASGIVELATTAETTEGADTERAVTPAGVKAAIDALEIDDLIIAGSNIADITLTSVTGEAGSEVIDLGTENANLKADLIAIKAKMNLVIAAIEAAGIVAAGE